MEAEAIAAFDFVEGRNMENFLGDQLFAVDQWLALVVEQVAVGAAESVVDLSQEGDQCPATLMAIPEADRIEDDAENTREGLQDNFAIGR